MKIKTTVTLCEQCKNNNWRHMDEIKTAAIERGDKPTKAVWCAASDRPENMRFIKCSHFETL